MTAQFMHVLIRLIVICTSLQLTHHVADASDSYSMYVWADGFDGSVPGCPGLFSLWDQTSYPQCFTHTWETADKRQWLWDTTGLQGRVINTLYVSDMLQRLTAAYNSADCNSPGLVPLHALLTEAYSRNVHIYALFGASDQAVSEKGMVKYVVWYNDQCAASQARFVGVAVNNEAFAHLKCGDEMAQTQHLDDLAEITSEASKQVGATLKTHFSMSWHWGICPSDLDYMLMWNGKIAKATDHMIDIFDSTDVQVGWATTDGIVDRLLVAGINYAKTLAKPMYTTVYTNKGPACQSTFFPQDCGDFDYDPSQAGMFAVFDALAADPDGQYAHPCIHYYRGIYSSGGHEDWPRITS